MIKLPRLNSINWKTQPLLFERYWHNTMTQIENILNELLALPIIQDAIASLNSSVDTINTNVSDINTEITSINSDITSINSSITTINNDLTSIHTELTDYVSAREYGVKADGRLIGGNATAGSSTLTVYASQGTFTNADIGKLITINFAGVGGIGHSTTITGVVSANVVNLAAPIVTTSANCDIIYGTDDTAALQAAVDYATLNNKTLLVSNGRICISSPIDFYRNNSWGFIGYGSEKTLVTQMSNNTSCLKVGSKTTTGVTGYMHDINISGMTIGHATLQTGQTSSNAMWVPYSGTGPDTSIYYSIMKDITFYNSYKGMLFDSGQEAPWGNSWGHFRFANLTGCAMDWTGTTKGTPGSEWGRMVIEMGYMTDAAFKNIRGGSWSIEVLEFLGNTGTNPSGGTGNQMIGFQAGSTCEIRALKIENINLTGVCTFDGPALIYAPSGTLHIGSLSLTGNTVGTATLTPTGRVVYIGGATADIKIDYITTSILGSVSNFTLMSTSGHTKIGYIAHAATVVPLTDIGNSASCNFITYLRNDAPRLSDDIGDANYTITTNGGNNVVVAQTAFTASRTVEIMNDTNYMYNGYTVRVISKGAVNGANTLVIKAGGATKATITADNYAVTLTWRRYPSAAHSGWVITDQGSLTTTSGIDLSTLTTPTYLDGTELMLTQTSGGTQNKPTVAQVLGGHGLRTTASYTLANTVAAQKMFNTTTNGAITLTAGLYEFVWQFQVVSMSATSGNATLSVVGAGTSSASNSFVHIWGIDVTGTAGTQTGSSFGNTATSISISSGSITGTTGTQFQGTITGVADFTAGTIIPDIALATAIGTASVIKGSNFRIRPIGATGAGAWGNTS